MRTARATAIGFGFENLLAVLVDSKGDISSTAGCEIVHTKCAVLVGGRQTLLDLLAAVPPDVKHRLETQSMKLNFAECTMIQLARSALNEKVPASALCDSLSALANWATEHLPDNLHAQRGILAAHLVRRMAGPFARKLRDYGQAFPQSIYWPRAAAKTQFWVHTCHPNQSFFQHPPNERGELNEHATIDHGLTFAGPTHLRLEYGGTEPDIVCDGWI